MKKISETQHESGFYPELPHDFGFTLVSEEEIKPKSVEDMQQKLIGLRNMILPLLNNLCKDESKTHIFWPDRITKIKEFINKINDYVDN